jgi:ferredoxin-NADP reductase/uncharacterized protein YcbX
MKVTNIVFYPVKGWSGLALNSAQLTPGRGLPFDRFLAVSNGSHAVAPTGWTACQAFVRMTKNPQLPLFKVLFNPASRHLQLIANGETVEIFIDQTQSVRSAENVLARWFPEHSPEHIKLHQQHGSLGWWDHPDAEVSLINEATVASMQPFSGVSIASSRFRGNLMIAGLAPWQELEWLGRDLQIGDVRLRVTRPIDRCRATSLNPTTGQSDVNMPALLGKHIGHVYCGVYAKVIKAGRVTKGDTIQVLPETANFDDEQPSTAPKMASWPRSAQVTECISASENVRHIWLHDALQAELVKSDSVPKAGQHIRVHITTPQGQTWRAYTVSKVDGNRLRLSIKRSASDGVSGWLHDVVKPGDNVLISGPYGTFTLENIRANKSAEEPLIFLSAGIGITPIVAMLQEIVRSKDWTAPVYIVHTSRNRKEAALWDEVERFVAQIQAHAGRSDICNGQLHLSQPDITIESRRLDFTQLKQLPWANASVVICGPDSFMTDDQEAAVQAGTPASHIHQERFFSPSQAPKMLRLDEPTTNSGPFKVTIQSQSKHDLGSFDWLAEHGSILDCAEKHQLELPANCRAGACGACVVKLNEGKSSIGKSHLYLWLVTRF